MDFFPTARRCHERHQASYEIARIRRGGGRRRSKRPVTRTGRRCGGVALLSEAEARAVLFVHRAVPLVTQVLTRGRNGREIPNMAKSFRNSAEGVQGSGNWRSDAFSISQRELGFILSFWLLFATVTFANRVLDPRRSDLDPTILFGNATIALTQAALWALFTVPLFLLAAYSTAERERRATQILLLLVATVAAALIVSSTVDFVRGEMFPFPRRGGLPAGSRGGGSRGGPSLVAGYDRRLSVSQRHRGCDGCACRWLCTCLFDEFARQEKS